MGEMADYYADWAYADELMEDQHDPDPKPFWRKGTKMAKVAKTAVARRRGKRKLILVQVGKHFIDPNDVVGIVKAGDKKGLYIVRLRSQPNPEYPLWVMEHELGTLLEQFDIIETVD